LALSPPAGFFPSARVHAAVFFVAVFFAGFFLVAIDYLDV
jgi:hypothetical protein